MTLEEQIDQLQDLVVRAYGKGSHVSLDPPGTRRGQEKWHGIVWLPSGEPILNDSARTKEALVVMMLASTREQVAMVEDEVEYEEDEDGD